MAGLTLVTPPAVESVTLAEAKSHLRVETADDDALIGDLLAAARQTVEGFLRRALITQTWRLTLDRFPRVAERWWDGVRQGAAVVERARAIVLPRPPLSAVTSLTVFDAADTPTVVPAGDYIVDTAAEPGRLVLRTGESWPVVGRAAAGVEVVFDAGYGAAGSAVPEAIRQGILETVAALYDRRGEGVAEARGLPGAAAALLAAYRIVGL